MSPATIDIKTDKARDLTLIVLCGKVSVTELVDTLKRFYAAKANITTNILWDFSNCDVTSLGAGDLSTVVNVARRYAALRPHGKSAFVATSEFAMGIGSMYASLSLLKNHPISNAVFRSAEEALAWLESS